MRQSAPAPHMEGGGHPVGGGGGEHEGKH
jgi:hypothetical protein